MLFCDKGPVRRHLPNKLHLVSELAELLQQIGRGRLIYTIREIP